MVASGDNILKDMYLLLRLKILIKKHYCPDNYCFLALFFHRVDLILSPSLSKAIKYSKLDLTLPKIFSIHS